MRESNHDSLKPAPSFPLSASARGEIKKIKQPHCGFGVIVTSDSARTTYLALAGIYHTSSHQDNPRYLGWSRTLKAHNLRYGRTVVRSLQFAKDTTLSGKRGKLSLFLGSTDPAEPKNTKVGGLSQAHKWFYFGCGRARFAWMESCS